MNSSTWDPWPSSSASHQTGPPRRAPHTRCPSKVTVQGAWAPAVELRLISGTADLLLGPCRTAAPRAQRQHGLPTARLRWCRPHPQGDLPTAACGPAASHSKAAATIPRRRTLGVEPPRARWRVRTSYSRSVEPRGGSHNTAIATTISATHSSSTRQTRATPFKHQNSHCSSKIGGILFPDKLSHSNTETTTQHENNTHSGWAVASQTDPEETPAPLPTLLALLSSDITSPHLGGNITLISTERHRGGRHRHRYLSQPRNTMRLGAH